MFVPFGFTPGGTGVDFLLMETYFLKKKSTRYVWGVFVIYFLRPKSVPENDGCLLLAALLK